MDVLHSNKLDEARVDAKNTKKGMKLSKALICNFVHS